MVSIFGVGGGRGPRGPAGPAGPRGPGIDLLRWFPNLALREFREIETCCLLLKNKDDLIGKEGTGYTTWKSHSGPNATAVKPSQHVLPVDDQYALQFTDNLYRVDGIEISSDDDRSYTVIIVTFKTNPRIQEQFLISDCQLNKCLFRGISIAHKEIRIHGVQNGSLNYLPIDYEPTTWTTMRVTWSNIGNLGGFEIKGVKSGTFHCTKVEECVPQHVSIGGLLKIDKKSIEKTLDGYISAIEIYTKTNAPEDSVPKCITDLIIEDQYIEEGSLNTSFQDGSHWEGAQRHGEQNNKRRRSTSRTRCSHKSIC